MNTQRARVSDLAVWAVGVRSVRRYVLDVVDGVQFGVDYPAIVGMVLVVAGIIRHVENRPQSL